MMTRFLFSLAFLASSTAWAVPTQLGHQGRVLDDSEVPMEGTQTLTFRLYDALESGTLAWEESHTVYLDNGFYSVVLGADEVNNPIDALLLDGGSLYLELQVQGESPLEPRHVLTSVPYSVVAGTSTNVAGGTVDASTIRVNGAEVIDSSGAWVGATPGIDEATVEDYITNGAIDLHAGTTIGGGECLVADSSGNVGIGTSSPDRTLDVESAGNFPQVRLTHSGTFNTDLHVTSNGTFRVTPTARTMQVGTGDVNGGNLQFTKSQGATIAGGVSWDTNDNDVTLYAEDDLHLGAGGPSQRMTIDLNGNVGIANTTPTEALDVTGNVVASGTICDTNGCIGSGGSGGSLWSQSGQDVSYTTGNVGIGTTSPIMSGAYTASRKLSLYGTAGRSILELGSSEASDGQPMGAIQFFNDDNTDDTNIDGDSKMIASLQAETVTGDNNASDDSGGKLVVYTKAEGGLTTAAMVVDSTGSVGIGTTSPTSSLDIEAEHPGITLRTNDADGDPQLKFVDSVGSQLAHVRVDNTGGSLNYVSLNAGTSENHLAIDSSGNVGIGNTSPTEALDVTGNIVASGTICDTNGCVGSGGSGTGPWSQSGQDVSYTTGNVGIGTTSPGQALEVASSTNDYVGGIILLTDTTTMAEGVGGGITFRGKYSTVTTEFAAIRAAKSNGTSGNYDADLAFFTRTNGEGNQGERMRIDSSGNVGIGTTSPGDYPSGTNDLVIENSVHTGMAIVSGPTSIGTIQFRTDTTHNGTEGWIDYSHNTKNMRFGTDGIGTTAMVISADDKVGIGTTTPTRLLHVAGDVQVDGVVYETSDARLKDAIDPIVGATDRVAGIQGVTWAYDREGNDNERYVGVLAQDVAEVLPEAVRTAQDGSLAVNYNGLVGLLVEAVKEQQVALDARDKELAAFETRLRKLEER